MPRSKIVKGIKLVLVRSTRTPTLLNKLPYFPKADWSTDIRIYHPYHRQLWLILSKKKKQSKFTKTFRPEIVLTAATEVASHLIHNLPYKDTFTLVDVFLLGFLFRLLSFFHSFFHNSNGVGLSFFRSYFVRFLTRMKYIIWCIFQKRWQSRCCW